VAGERQGRGELAETGGHNFLNSDTVDPILSARRLGHRGALRPADAVSDIGPSLEACHATVTCAARRGRTSFFLQTAGIAGGLEISIGALAPLSETWRTVVYEHRGTGESLLKRALAGFSRGVMTVMRAVPRHPERFEGLSGDCV
jgi:hypothetical protein